MRNLKKLLALVVAVCTILAFTIPTFAADTTALALDTQTVANIGVLIGQGSGVTAAYGATTPTRIQAAVLLLRLTGNLTEAQNFTGTDTFADAEKATWAKPLMAYLKAHPELGFVGDGKNFMPNENITAQQYYKVILTALGYAIPGDYVYADTLKFAKDTAKLAMVGNTASFTIDSFATVTVEALKATTKGTTKTLANKLVDKGVITNANAVLYIAGYKATAVVLTTPSTPYIPYTAPTPVVAVSAVAISSAGNTITVVKGETLQMSASITPSNATNKAVTWSVTPTSGTGAGTATIDATTGVLTGTSNGKVDITATANGIKGYMTITVVNAPQSVISNVNISSSNSDNTKAMNGDTITLTFTSNEPVTKLNSFKINGSSPNTFTNVGDVYTATHLVDVGDTTGSAVTFQINVQNAKGVYSQTIEQTTDNSSVTIIAKYALISDVNFVSNNANNTQAMDGDTITLKFKSDEPVTKLSDFKINGSNPNSFTDDGNNNYTVTHLVDVGDSVTGSPATFQINVQNATGIYSPTIEATTDGSSVTIINKYARITNVSIASNNSDPTKAVIGEIVTLTFTSDESVTKLSNFKINGSNPDTFTNTGNVYTATHLVDAGDAVGTATFQINVKNLAGIYSPTIEQTTDGSSVTVQ